MCQNCREIENRGIDADIWKGLTFQFDGIEKGAPIFTMLTKGGKVKGTFELALHPIDESYYWLAR